MVPGEVLMQFKSHIQGKNANVQIFADRIEWERPRGISGAKITTGVITGGLSLAATGVRSGRAGAEMIPVKNISSVTTRRDGLMYTAVCIVTSGNTIDFRVPHKDARPIKDLIGQLVLGNHPAQATTSTAPRATPTPTRDNMTDNAPRDTPSVVGELTALAKLRDDGVLTDEEFAAEKAKLLRR